MYDKILDELRKFFDEVRHECTMDYMYGFFDAVAIIRDLAEKS